MTNLLHVDPDHPGLPSGLGAPAAGVAEVVVLLADEGSHERGWARLTAVEIARAWGSSGLRVVLVDGDSEGAGLHDLVGVANEEGVADMVLFGSSPTRVSRRIEGERFLFVSAGTSVADPAALFSHPRWSTVVSHYRDSGCVLLLYLPEKGRGTPVAATIGDRVVRFASFAPADGPEGETVVVGATTTASGGTPTPEPAPLAELTLDAAWGEGLDGAGEIEGAVPAVDEASREDTGFAADARASESHPPAADPRAAALPAAATPPEGPRSEVPRIAGGPTVEAGSRRLPNRTLFLLLVLLGVILGVVALAWLGYIEIPGLFSIAPGSDLLPGADATVYALTADPALKAETTG